MGKIELIDEAIEKAIRRESKLTPLALSVPMLGSLRIRHLLNNLGAISSRFIDVGSHRGGSYCSTVFKNPNIVYACAVDSWESDKDLPENEKNEIDFMENATLMTPAETVLEIVKSDAFASLDKLPITEMDLFSYDAGHSREDQKNALIYYRPILSSEFIYCCDDWMFEEVKPGTMDGIEEGGYEILHMRELINETPGDGHLNDEWWRSYAVFLLKKK
jgi:hypothetical protein